MGREYLHGQVMLEVAAQFGEFPLLPAMGWLLGAKDR